MTMTSKGECLHQLRPDLHRPGEQPAPAVLRPTLPGRGLARPPRPATKPTTTFPRRTPFRTSYPARTPFRSPTAFTAVRTATSSSPSSPSPSPPQQHTSNARR